MLKGVNKQINKRIRDHLLGLTMIDVGIIANITVLLLVLEVSVVLLLMYEGTVILGGNLGTTLRVGHERIPIMILLVDSGEMSILILLHVIKVIIMNHPLVSGRTIVLAILHRAVHAMSPRHVLGGIECMGLLHDNHLMMVIVDGILIHHLLSINFIIDRRNVTEGLVFLGP